jgi:Cof subfamily protein (haloacid dehalogenase superfamily)
MISNNAISKREIKLIATDLDGTLLNPDHSISDENKDALLRCIAKGIHVVVATGRPISAIPTHIREIEGIEYLISSNGAKVHENATERQLYAKYLSEKAIKSVWDIFVNPAVMKEVFWNGIPYIDTACYNEPTRFGVPERAKAYIHNTRKPTADLLAFTMEHIDEIENINFNYANEDVKRWLYGKLSKNTDLYELTASLAFNFEIGGIGVTKADAVDCLRRKLNLKQSEIMCFGDNRNDMGMIEYAGIGVAMDDAVPEVKRVADVVTLSASESGVAFAINALL